MFSSIVLALFLLVMYVIVKKENKIVKITIFSYFILLSIVFLIGRFFIINTYNLDYAPLDGGFESLIGWVGVFAYFYIIPTFFILAYMLFQLSKKIFKSTWLRTIMYILLLLILGGICYISFYIFVLIYYGFAP